MEKSKAKEQQKGLDCPSCRFKITFTMMDVVTKKSIVCPSCHLVLNMDVPVDRKQHLQEISLAEQMFRELSKSLK